MILGNVSRGVGSVSIGRTIRVLISCLILLFLTVAANSAELLLSQTGALPGETISLTGRGFESSELVTVTVGLSGEAGAIGESYRLTPVSADASGIFTIFFDIPEDYATLREVHFVAIGNTSGQTATATVLRTNTVLELFGELPSSICFDTLDLGDVVSVCFQLQQRCPNNTFAPLAGRELLFFLNDGGCGANVGQEADVVVVSDESGIACVEFTGADLLTMEGLNSIRVRFDGEPTPPSSEPGNSACDPDEYVYLSTSNACESFMVTSGCAQEVVDFDVTFADSADLYYVRSIDIDRDNFVDVVFTGKSTEGLFIAYGAPGGSLETPLSYLNVSQHAFGFGFINEDTLMDIVAVRDQTVYLLLNQGFRVFDIDSFTVSTINRADSLVPSITVGYFDGDKYLDVLVGPSTLLSGDGDGTSFTESELLFTILASAKCDLDNSGSADLIVVGENRIETYLNDGSAQFTQSYSVAVPAVSIDVPPSIAVSDFNRDDNCDYAVVLPANDSTNVSILWVFVGDGTGRSFTNSSHLINGLAYNVVASDVNRDGFMDLTVANGTDHSLFIFYGDGDGNFDTYQVLNLGTDGNETYTVAVLDIDRDGNTDFVSGGIGGGELIISKSNEPDEPVIEDEMVVFGFSNLDVAVKNPSGYEISPTYSTVSGSDYQEVDINGDGQIDERTLDYNLELGEYEITLILEPDAGDEPSYAAAIGIDGSQQAVIYLDYNAVGSARDTFVQPESLVFYYTVEEVSSISPPNGYPVGLSRPLFQWSLNADPHTGPFHFQLDRYYDFRAPIFDTTGLTAAEFLPDKMLNDDSVYYWRYRYQEGGVWSEFSRTFAVFITGVCCEGSSGNANGDEGGDVDISDVTYLAGYLFQGYDAPGDPAGCYGAGNVDGEDIVNIADITALVEFLFSDGAAPALCP